MALSDSMKDDARAPRYGGTRSTACACWLIAISLATIAVCMLIRLEPGVDRAFAQSVHSAGARGIFAFTGQMTPTTYGVYMVDVDAGTIWCYEYVNVGGAKRLRLVSARSWIFDRYLEEYNIDGLSPTDVEEMIKAQRAKLEPPGAPESSIP